MLIPMITPLLKKILLFISVVLMICSLQACGGGAPQQQQGPMPVRTFQPQSRDVTLWDEYIGRFTAVNRVEIRPRVSGYLEEVHFQDGAMVEEGALLFTVDQRPFQASLSRAEAEFEAVRTQRNLAEAELKRASELLEARAGSQEEYDQALQSRDAARANLQAAQAAVRQASLDLDFTEIRAPIAGRISQHLVDIGNLVSAEQSLLTTIVSVDPIYFEFSAAEQDYQRYLELDRSGDRASSRTNPNPVRIRIANQQDYSVEGVMDFVDNEIDATTGTILGRARIDNPSGLLTPGLFGELRLYGRDPYEAILIPDSAVQFDQSRQFVWIVSAEGQAQMQFITPGRLVEDDMRIIDDGLSPDHQVIIGGLAMLQPGVPVQPKPQGAGDAPGPAAAAQN